MASKKAKKGKQARRQATGASSKSVSSTVVRQPLEQNQLHSGTGPVLEAKSLYEGGKIVEALRLCLAILQEQGPNPEILELAGRAAYANGQTAAAISLLEKALALDAKRVPTLELLLEVAGEAGDKDRVKRIAQELSRLRSGDGQSTTADSDEEEALPAAELAVKTEKSEQVPEVLTKIFGLTSRLRVVDIGSNPIDGTPPYADLLKAGAVDLVGFVPQRDALAKLNKTKGPHEIYYPHAVGDGKPATLYLCRAPGMTSTLKPNFGLLNHFQGYPQWAEIVGTETVQTVRLDDLEEVGSIDWLKIDIQGGELRVFEHGEQRLANALVIQTEANFIPLYEGQPLFADIDTWMRAHGFMLHALLEERRRLYAPLQVNNQIHQGLNQVTTADAVYVPNLGRMSELSVDQLSKLAVILHSAYGSHDLALRVLMIRDLKDGGDQAEKFLVSLGIPRREAEAELKNAKRELHGTLANKPDLLSCAMPAEVPTARAGAEIRRDKMANTEAPFKGFSLSELEVPAVTERIVANVRKAEEHISQKRYVEALPFLERAWMLAGPEKELVNPLLQLYMAAGRFRDAVAITHAWAMRCYDDNDIAEFSDAVAMYHSLVIRMNHQGITQPLHDPTLVRSARKLFAQLDLPEVKKKEGSSRRLRIAYVIPLETEKDSTLTALPVELAERHDKEDFEIEIFSLFPESHASQVNPSFKGIVDRVKEGGWAFHPGRSNKDVLSVALDLVDRIKSRQCDVVVFSIQMGVHWLAALLRPAPVVVGIDWGHPHWYSSPELDYVVAPHKHFRMEAFCDALPWRPLTGAIRHNLENVVPHQRSCLGLSESSVVIASSGNLDKFRDQRFWEVVNTVLERRKNCEWLIIGVESSQVPQGLVDDSVSSRVRFIGRREDFTECVAAADIYVDTFPIGGGFALTPVIVSGVPCVGARHEYDQLFNKAVNYSILDILMDDQDLTVGRSPADIVEKTLELVDDPLVRKDFAQRQRRDLEKHLDLDSRVSELEDLYRYAVEAKGY